MKGNLKEWIESSSESLNTILDGEDVVFDACNTTLGRKVEDAYNLLWQANSLIAEIKASI